MHSWIGLGPSAASQHAGWRGANLADLDGWLARLGKGERMTEDRSELSPSLLAEDGLIFGLRMNEGVDLAPLEASLPPERWGPVAELVSRLVSEDLLLLDATRARLSPRGRLVADAVGSEFLGLLSSQD